MKVIKRILLGLIAIIVLLLVSGFFIKKEIHSEREIVINRPKEEVFSYIKMLKNEMDYGKWNKMDPAMKTEYRGEDGKAGFVYAWESQKSNVGSGEQEIKKIDEGNRIDYELRFKKPMESTADVYMITEDAGSNQTKVRWGFNSQMKYPFNIMRLFMDMEGRVGDDFSEGLKNLKTNLESQKGSSAVK